MNYPAYPTYKESGVPWLGKVPEHWEVKRLKMFAHLNEQKVEADSENPLLYIGLENIESGTGKIHSIDNEAVPSGIANKFSCTDTLFGKLRPYLAKACNPYFSGLCSTELLVLEIKEFERRAIIYWLLADGFIQLVNSSTYGSKMPRANWGFIGNCRLPVPPLSEQIAIADFLDRETGRIDTLIEKKQRLIGLLREKRSALISATITRGLPADAAREFGLEPHTRFKDSGIEWLGEVPEGCEVKNLRYVFIIHSGSTPKSGEPLLWDGDIVWFTPEDLGDNQNKFISDSKRKITFAGYSSCGTSLAKQKSVVISTRAPIGHVALSTISSCCNQGCRILEPKEGISDYWYYVLFAAKSVLNALGQGSTFLELPRQSLAGFKIPFPPTPEQTAIATYLDRETGTIDKLTSKVEQAIERLQEYRAALITAAVTGKIDVRNSEESTGQYGLAAEEAESYG